MSNDSRQKSPFPIMRNRVSNMVESVLTYDCIRIINTALHPHCLSFAVW